MPHFDTKKTNKPITFPTSLTGKGNADPMTTYCSPENCLKMKPADTLGR